MLSCLRLLSAAAILFSATAAHAQGVPSTSEGRVSVAQIISLIERSASDPSAQTAAIAYLAGVGETAGILIEEGENRQPGLAGCEGALTLSTDAALAALSPTSQSRRTETAATPILVADMLSRAGCR